MPNPVIKTDARQLVHRDLLDQLTTASAHAGSVVGGKKVDTTQLNDLFTAANSDLIFPIRMIASDPVDLVITLDAATITNTGTGRNRTLYPMDDIVSAFAGGTITFSAAFITPSIGVAIPMATSNGTFNKLGVFIDSSGNIVLVEGTEGASIALAVAPSEQPGMTYIGYIDFGVDGGGNITDTASVAGQLINTDIYQFTNPTPGISGIVNQDRGMKLLGGGNWSATAGPVLNWDADTFIQVPSMANDRNTIPLAASGIAIGVDQVAYVDINRIDPLIATDISGTLTVVDVDAFVPADDRVIFARENDGAIIIGDLFRLIVGESQTLEASASNETLTLLGTGVTEATSTPTYAARGAPERTLVDAEAMLDAMASMDVEVDKFFGQLRVEPHATLVNRVTITGVDFTMKDNVVLSKELSNIVMEFTGAEIDFTSGVIYESDGTTPRTETAPIGGAGAGEYLWYSLAIIADVANVTTGAMTATIIAQDAASSNAVQADASFASFGGNKRIAQVQILENGGAYEVQSIRQFYGVDKSSEQDRNLKLVEGGVWAVAAANTLSWSADAYIQIPGQLNTRNTIAANPGGTAIPDGSVAYVDMNRLPGAVAITAVTVDTISNVDGAHPDILIIARGVSDGVIVGNNSFLLKVGQSEELESNLSIENRTLIGTAVDETLAVPTYSTRSGGAPERTIDDSQGILDALASIDIELDKFHGQFRIEPHATLAERATVTGADFIMKDGAVLSQEFSDFIASFEGAEIDFSSGTIYESDGATPLGIDFTFTPTAPGQFVWYSLSLVCELMDANNRAQLQLTVVPGVAGASAAAAVFPDFSGDRRIGQVLIENVGGAETVNTVRQLGSGSGTSPGFTTVSISTSQTLDNRKHYLVDSTPGGTVTLTLPNGKPGFKIRISDSESNAELDNIEIFPASGERFEEGAVDEEFLLDVYDSWVELTWDNTIGQWQVDLNGVAIALSKQIYREMTAATFDALLPIAHGFGEIPVFMELWVDNGVDFEQHDAGAYVVSDLVDLKTSGTTLASIVGGATNIRFTAQERLNTAEQDKWETQIITSTGPINATSRGEYLVDTITAGGVVTLVLPLAPTVGQRVRVKDAVYNAGTDNIIIDRNGELIETAAANITMNTNGAKVDLVYMDIANGWIILG